MVENCKHFLDSKEYYKLETCIDEIMTREVMPIHPYPDLLIKYMANKEEFARYADKNNLAKEDYAIGYKKVKSEYALEIAARNSQIKAIEDQKNERLVQTGLQIMQASQPTPEQRQQQEINSITSDNQSLRGQAKFG